MGGGQGRGGHRYQYQVGECSRAPRGNREAGHLRLRFRRVYLGREDDRAERLARQYGPGNHGGVDRSAP